VLGRELSLGFVRFGDLGFEVSEVDYAGYALAEGGGEGSGGDYVLVCGKSSAI
jgi:hypothetical protein